ncbi:N-formylglutamate amidohydrolase [Shinella sp.]|uniref:N-formylglutamate amidohydrolase n=1 Tax=Shinella sp. TaxID=1870904 RepID=UPI0029BDD87E|nr:N-formylglutamate amidohydrolase [Shinella sp.]MDX3974276.1 N-formylglutamate amidohydrolase [Shinella sp.]
MLDDIDREDEHAWWTTQRGASPIVGTAIHNGHAVRQNLLMAMALDDDERLREEDPFTAETIRGLANRIVFHRSRFEIDLNRARDVAIYLRPEQAWGLEVWRTQPSEAELAESLSLHDAYYGMLENYLCGVEAQHGRFVVLDMHSYNHRRAGPSAPPTEASDAPEINIGTSSMDRSRWAPVVDAFMNFAADFDFLGRRLDVRENVAFEGRGEQTRFIHARFPQNGCAIAVEFKKVFMDEWTGAPDWQALAALQALVAGAAPVLEQALREVA